MINVRFIQSVIPGCDLVKGNYRANNLLLIEIR